MVVFTSPTQYQQCSLLRPLFTKGGKQYDSVSLSLPNWNLGALIVESTAHNNGYCGTTATSCLRFVLKTDQ
ncbi:unnamed protein product [Allacma fusca]|uniref:Uncharacterized protein n=1 Tax=Allacma fusca TaxID=39272 RepID=A0A8J2LBS5_9HEXA|nr:unnamed protein product [Allacma fusca]